MLNIWRISSIFFTVFKKTIEHLFQGFLPKSLKTSKDFFIFPGCSSKKQLKISRISFKIFEHFDVFCLQRSSKNPDFFWKSEGLLHFFSNVLQKNLWTSVGLIPKSWENLQLSFKHFENLQDFCNYPECWQTLHLIAAPLNLTLQRMHFGYAFFEHLKTHAVFICIKNLYECICIFSSWQKNMHFRYAENMHY